MTTPFSWPHPPKVQADFEALMQAIDSRLTSQGLTPAQRPPSVGRLLWEAFRLAGDVFPPKELAQQEGFEGEVLLAKAHRWYRELYADNLKMNFGPGAVPVRIRNAIWRVRVAFARGGGQLFLDRNLENRGVTIGVPASLNMLCAIGDFTQAIANRLDDLELRSYAETYSAAFDALQWRDELPRTELLNMARADYDASTEDVLGRRYGQARWSAQQAAEKTIKGLLKLAGTPFPTGADGHKLLRLSNLLSQHHGIALPADALGRASCSAAVRYAEEPSTEEQALVANHAFLSILRELRAQPNVSAILQIVQSSGASS
jgi:HEPN domain-containing protein